MSGEARLKQALDNSHKEPVRRLPSTLFRNCTHLIMLSNGTETIGTLVPFADPLWMTTLDSPYFKDSHRRLSKYLRKYVDEELSPYCADWEADAAVPDEAQKRFAEVGCTAACVFPLAKGYMDGITLPAGIPANEWDAFHDFVLIDELMRCGYLGVCWALATGNIIGCPPLVNFGSEALKRELLPQILKGQKRICLGVTEPSAGSDVANIATTARREGDYFIVNGSKKWITNAVYSDYVTAAVRTGGPGAKGISCLIIPLNLPGVERRKLQNSGVASSGSTLIDFEDVKVPAKYLVGQENQGFKIFMSNFNHDRLCKSPFVC
jgi:alkylation response protein AidB-like acyl-CoA dehydrogenase